MPLRNHEIDVFTIPHCRIKQRVQFCTEKLISTDFTNNDALMCVLSNLFTAFKEFKSHEEIENEFIMKKLKTRLREKQVHNSAVCNCHNDDQFSPLLSLVDSGYVYLNKQKTASDKLNYGVKLRKALKEFVRAFLPHMKEEEDVFQPLLMQYFTEKELMEMKILVIKSHMQQRKKCNVTNDAEDVIRLNKINVSIERKNDRGHVKNLPNEMLIKIFAYFNTKDLLSLAKVCRKWNTLVADPYFWKRLSYRDWKDNSCKLDTNYYIHDILDDIDHGDDEDFFTENERLPAKDVKLLRFWIKRLLPRVGKYIQNLDLSHCKALNTNLTQRILQLCPNLVTLNLSYSNVKDNAFKEIKLNQLEIINFEACLQITDRTIEYFFSNRNTKPETKRKEINCKIDLIKESCENHTNCDCCLADRSNQLKPNKLIEAISPVKNSFRSINFSGCFALTDLTLKLILKNANLIDLTYLNLSGCSNISSSNLKIFLNKCAKLEFDQIYYCDNIQLDGQVGHLANGCENVECSERFCCRN